MSSSWENFEPAPLEYFHGKLMDAFHQLRLQKGDNPDKTLTLSGSEMNNLIAKIKVETYSKYPNAVSRKAIPKLGTPFPPGGPAIANETGQEIIVVDDPGYGGISNASKMFDATLAKRLNK